MAHLATSGLNRTVAILVTVALVTVQLGASAAPAMAGKPADDLKEIQYKQYFRGKYDEAIGALEKFLERKDLSAQDRLSAHEFLAASYVLSGKAERGQEIFLRVQSELPDYTGPDPSVFREEVIAAYEAARDAYAQSRIRTAPPTGDDRDEAAPAMASSEGGKPIYKQWWLYAGLATAVLVVGALSRENNDDPTGGGGPTGTVDVGVVVR